MSSAAELAAHEEREKKGDRKRARAAATTARRLAREQLEAELSVPPSTSEEASKRWDRFYETKRWLFKDRHLLRSEFPEMMGEQAAKYPQQHVLPLRRPGADGPEMLTRDARCDLTLVEAGCGSGNGVFPILRANDRLFAYAFDYSAKAVKLMQAHDEYREDRVEAFQADLSEPTSYVDTVRADVPCGVDFVTALWALSALRPGREMQVAAEGLAALLKEGGRLFVRDYAAGDMREAKFEQRRQGVDCGEGTGRLYLRGDGTYAYFFETAELKGLFEKVGLICEICEYVNRDVENRKDQIKMSRRWIHAKFVKN